MSDEVTLKVNGQRYGGWKTARVTRGIETLAGTFELDVSERWANQEQGWPFREDDACVLSIGGTDVITGRVRKRRKSFSASEHAVTLFGADKTIDLVECSAILDKWEYSNFDLVKLAEKLCKPFGIKVSVQPGLTLPGQSLTVAKKLHIDPGETLFNILEHACRLAAVLPVSGDDGELLLTRAGSERADDRLVEGKNILTADAEFDASGRFHEYVVLGQHATAEDFFGESATTIKASAIDPNVKRTERRLVVRPEGNVTTATAKLRAQWEATVRAARADTATISVAGWTQSNGQLWPVNAIVGVKSKEIEIDGEMLITQATYSVGPDGRTTTMLLKRPDAFKPEPQVSRDGLWKETAKGV